MGVWIIRPPAPVVKLNLAFMEWSFYNLVIIIRLYKIRYLHLDEALFFPRKIGNFDELQLPQSLIFFAEILHTFLT